MQTLLFRSLLCFLLLGTLLPEATAQPKQRRGKVFIYKAIITTTAGDKVKAWLYDVDEVQVYLTTKKANPYTLRSLEPTMTLQPNEIQTIKLRRKGSFIRSTVHGALIGAGIAVGTQVLISSGRSGSEKFSFSEIVRGSVRPTVYGAIIGVPFGFNISKKFDIGRSHTTYSNMRDLLRAYSIKGQME